MTKKARPIFDTNSRTASDLTADIEPETRGLSEIASVGFEAQRQMLATNGDRFTISTDQLPTIVEGRNLLITWLWSQAIQRAKGDTKKTAEILGVTPTYVNFLGRRIRRGLPPTSGRKKCGNRKAGSPEQPSLVVVQTINARELTQAIPNATTQEEGQ
jgi:hypothetical protein